MKETAKELQERLGPLELLSSFGWHNPKYGGIMDWSMLQFQKLSIENKKSERGGGNKKRIFVYACLGGWIFFFYLNFKHIFKIFFIRE